MPTLARILIKGELETDVHGTGLREEVCKIAKSFQIEGRVENIKGLPVVQVVCKKDKSAAFIDNLRKELPRHSLFGNIKIQDPQDYILADYEKLKDEFEIVRSDELTEMVWALQGAGKMFRHAQKAQMETRANSMMAAVRAELISMMNVCDDIQAGYITRFCPVATEHFIKEPPELDDTPIERLREFY